jgi:hypothetical protein
MQPGTTDSPRSASSRHTRWLNDLRRRARPRSRRWFRRRCVCCWSDCLGGFVGQLKGHHRGRCLGRNLWRPVFRVWRQMAVLSVTHPDDHRWTVGVHCGDDARVRAASLDTIGVHKPSANGGRAKRNSFTAPWFATRGFRGCWHPDRPLQWSKESNGFGRLIPAARAMVSAPSCLAQRRPLLSAEHGCLHHVALRPQKVRDRLSVPFVGLVPWTLRPRRAEPTQASRK